MRELERKENTFTPVPSPYYMELTKLLLNQWVFKKKKNPPKSHIKQGRNYETLDNGSLCVFFFCSASDNIPKADEIRTLVKDIWDTRIAKLRLSADSFIREQEAHAKVKLRPYDAYYSKLYSSFRTNKTKTVSFSLSSFSSWTTWLWWRSTLFGHFCSTPLTACINYALICSRAPVKDSSPTINPDVKETLIRLEKGCGIYWDFLSIKS